MDNTRGQGSMPADDDHPVNGASAAEWEACALRMLQTVRDIDAYERRCAEEGIRPEPGLLRSRDSLRRLLGDFDGGSSGASLSPDTN